MNESDEYEIRIHQIRSIEPSSKHSFKQEDYYLDENQVSFQELFV